MEDGLGTIYIILGSGLVIHGLQSDGRYVNINEKVTCAVVTCACMGANRSDGFAGSVGGALK